MLSIIFYPFQEPYQLSKSVRIAVGKVNFVPLHIAEIVDKTQLVKQWRRLEKLVCRFIETIDDAIKFRWLVNDAVTTSLPACGIRVCLGVLL